MRVKPESLKTDTNRENLTVFRCVVHHTLGFPNVFDILASPEQGT